MSALNFYARWQRIEITGCRMSASSGRAAAEKMARKSKPARMLRRQ